MARKGNEFDQEMVKLEAEIKRLEAEYNMFFAGRLPRLPWETRSRVETLVKRYDRMNIVNTAERFRFGTLQARFAKFCELWERSLKAKEEGRPTRSRTAAAAAGPMATGDLAARSKERELHVAKVRDPARDADGVRGLYDRLSEARQKAGEKPLPYERFVEVVKAQVKKHGGGGADVSFRVAVKDGKVTLSAKGQE
jgi:hypothetical protein